MSRPTGSRRRRRARLWAVGVLVVALVAGAGAVAVRLRTNISVLNVNDALSDPDLAVLAIREPRPTPSPDGAPTATPEPPLEEDAGQPLNILVMGSDTREGQGDAFGSAALIDGARSDTTLLVHLAADRQRVIVVSIPRDLLVTIASCTLADGSSSYPYQDRFNAAFSIGGPECTIRTVGGLTGLPIHHFVVVDFTAFQRTVDALGGVEVCLTEAVDDPKAGLSLPAGVSRVGGDQALAFVRARETLGDGSDLARIERQQAFLGSLVREATSRELLVDPVRLFRSLDAATQSLTMDASLAWLPRTASIARSLSSIEPANVSFVTLPSVDNDDLLTVSPDEGRSALLFDLLARDAAWPLQPSSAAPVLVPPERTPVSVVNATGLPDQATMAGGGLQAQGFNVLRRSIGPAQEATEVRHPGSALEAARTVAAAVDGAVLVPDDSLDAVTLVLGRDFDVADLRTVAVQAAPAQGGEPAPAPADGPDWVVPDSGLPTGQTSTADTSTCAS